MASSASAFTASLVDEMAEAAPPCTIRRRLPDGECSEPCGEPGGRAEASCPHGHIRRGILCARHAQAGSPHKCGDCWVQHQRIAYVTVRTEVA